MKKVMLSAFALSLILVGCSDNENNMQSQESPMNNGHMDDEEREEQGMSGMQGMMNLGNVPSLETSEGINELLIPPLME